MSRQHEQAAATTAATTAAAAAAAATTAAARARRGRLNGAGRAALRLRAQPVHRLRQRRPPCARRALRVSPRRRPCRGRRLSRERHLALSCSPAAEASPTARRLVRRARQRVRELLAPLDAPGAPGAVRVSCASGPCFPAAPSGRLLAQPGWTPACRRPVPCRLPCARSRPGAICTARLAAPGSCASSALLRVCAPGSGV